MQHRISSGNVVEKNLLPLKVLKEGFMYITCLLSHAHSSASSNIVPKKGRWGEFGWFSPPLHCADETAECAAACPRWCWKNRSRLFQSHSIVWMSGHWQPDTITPKLNNPLLRITGPLHVIAHDYMSLLYKRRKLQASFFYFLYELFWTWKPGFMVGLARLYLQGAPSWKMSLFQTLCTLIELDDCEWMKSNEICAANFEMSLPRLHGRNTSSGSRWLRLNPRVDPLLQSNGNHGGEPIRRINYLKHISVAKYLIAWNTVWMLLWMCRRRWQR